MNGVAGEEDPFCRGRDATIRQGLRDRRVVYEATDL
jgi:hypothetical protein